MRKTIYFIVTITLLATASLAGMSYSALRDANAKLASITSENADLKAKVIKQETEIKKFDNISKADLLEVCINRARENFSKYIDDNSVSKEEGLVTTYMPKFPGMMATATKELDKAEKSCKDAFKV